MGRKGFFFICLVFVSLMLCSCMSFGFFNSKIETRKDVFIEKGHVVEQVVEVLEINVSNNKAAYAENPKVEKNVFTKFSAYFGIEQVNGIITSRFVEFNRQGPVDPNVPGIPVLLNDCYIFIGSKQSFSYHADAVSYTVDPEKGYCATLRFELSPECLDSIMNANLVQLQFFTDPQMVDLGEKAEVTMMITDQALGQVKILLH